MLSTPPTLDQIHVMLVDDSAVIRGALTKIIEADISIKIVQSINNGELAIAAAAKTKPHVIILDVEMPIMDGLTALPKILEASPESRVIMFSSLTDKGADISIKALALGAVECIAKPSSAAGVGEGSEFQRQLISTIKGLVPIYERRPAEKNDAQPAAPSKPAEAPQAHKNAAATAAAPSSSYTLHDDTASYKGKPNLVMIGSSTGGPQALFEVIKSFSDFDVPIVITQHMPATFTKLLAEHISTNTGVPAQEGAEGMTLENGQVYVAPGGKHMTLERESTFVKIRINDGPPENFCKPSVDPMFRSAIALYGNKILAVMLTGMGNDGLQSSKELVEKGGRLIAQDQETSIVWGMPGAVAQAGICSQVLPLKEIGPWVRRAVLV